MSIRLVLKSVTLNDLERRNGAILRYFSEFGYSFLMNSCSQLRLPLESCYTNKRNFFTGLRFEVEQASRGLSAIAELLV